MKNNNNEQKLQNIMILLLYRTAGHPWKCHFTVGQWKHVQSSNQVICVQGCVLKHWQLPVSSKLVQNP